MKNHAEYEDMIKAAFGLRIDDTPTEPEPTYDSELAEAERPPPPPHAIMGPSTTVYPRNAGWHPEEQTPLGTNDAPCKLSDLTIHNCWRVL